MSSNTEHSFGLLYALSQMICNKTCSCPVFLLQGQRLSLLSCWMESWTGLLILIQILYIKKKYTAMGSSQLILMSFLFISSSFSSIFFSPGYFILHSSLFSCMPPPCIFQGLSNIIGIIVYISANSGDPSKSDSKKNSYSYGWSFYFGALSFIMAEMVGVLAVHMFIDRHRQLRIGARAADYLQGSAITRIPSYRYRYRRRSRSSSRSTDPSHSRDNSPVGLKGFSALPSTEISMYTLPRDTLKSSGTPTATYNSERDHNFLQVHNCIQKDLKDSSHTNTANRRTTPV